jgi:hypothetical protein
MKTLGGRLAALTVGMLVSGAAMAALAFGVRGWLAVEGVVYAMALCLIPGWLTVLSAELLRSRDLSAYVVLIGTGFRMVFVLLGCFAIGILRRDLGFFEFTVWLIPSYLVALALETAVILRTIVGEKVAGDKV